MNDAYLGCVKEGEYYVDTAYAAEYDCSYVNDFIADNLDFAQEDWVSGCLALDEAGACAEYECIKGEWVEGAADEYGYTEWDYVCTYTTATTGLDVPSIENGWYGCGYYAALNDDQPVTC